MDSDTDANRLPGSESECIAFVEASNRLAHGQCRVNGLGG